MRFLRRGAASPIDDSAWQFLKIVRNISGDEWADVLRAAGRRWGGGVIDPDAINVSLAVDGDLEPFRRLLQRPDIGIQGVLDAATTARQEGHLAEGVLVLFPGLSPTLEADLKTFEALTWLADSLVKMASLAVATQSALPDRAVAAAMSSFATVWPSAISPDARAQRPVSVSGAFGPGTGLVLAFDEQVATFTEMQWRAFASATLAMTPSDIDGVNAAIGAIQDGAHGMDGTSLIQAHRWAEARYRQQVAALPDPWFEGHLPDGRPTVPSGNKSVAAHFLALAAAALAGSHYATRDAVAGAVGPVAPWIDMRRLESRAGQVRDPQLTDPFHGTGERRVR